MIGRWGEGGSDAAKLFAPIVNGLETILKCWLSRDRYKNRLIVYRWIGSR